MKSQITAHLTMGEADRAGFLAGARTLHEPACISFAPRASAMTLHLSR